MFVFVICDMRGFVGMCACCSHAVTNKWTIKFLVSLISSKTPLVLYAACDRNRLSRPKILHTSIATFYTIRGSKIKMYIFHSFSRVSS